MTINKTTLKEIQQFAKDTTKSPSNNADAPYFEILGTRVNQAFNQAKKQAIKLHIRSNRHQEESDELAGYMIDYVTALVDQEHMSEEDALKKAEMDFKVDNPQNPLLNDPRYDAWKSYYASIEPNIQEAIGLTYVSWLLIGFTIGTMLGILGQVWYTGTMLGWVFWIMMVLGILLGIGLGMAGNARISLKHHSDG